jgi:hypothetical protein
MSHPLPTHKHRTIYSKQANAGLDADALHNRRRQSLPHNNTALQLMKPPRPRRAASTETTGTTDSSNTLAAQSLEPQVSREGDKESSPMVLLYTL